MKNKILIGALLILSLCLSQTSNAQVIIQAQAFINSSGTASGPILCTDGTAALPSCGAFASQPGLGFFRPGANHIAIGNSAATGGLPFDFGQSFTINSAGFILFSSTTNAFSGASDVGINRQGVGVVQIGDGGANANGSLKAANINAVTAFQANGVAGATHSACSTAVTAITVANGIITSITCT